jgi:hypothetical protein
MDFILETYIRDISICDSLIDFFHNSEFAKVNRHSGTIGLSVDKKRKKSTDLCFYQSDWENIPLIKEYIDQLVECAHEYIQKYPYSDEGDPWGLVEGFNIQWYKPGEGFYIYHTERNIASHPFNNRHLVWMTYLNDVKEGGGTEFYHQKHTVQAKKGKTLIWPSDWTYTHRGEVALNEHKYVITGWFSYDMPD